MTSVMKYLLEQWLNSSAGKDAKLVVVNRFAESKKMLSEERHLGDAGYVANLSSVIN